MLKKWLMGILVLVLMVGIMSGCGSAPIGVKVEQNQKDKPNTEAFYPIQMVDLTGTEVVLEHEPKRIISLYPSHTEILFALGIGQHVVAVTQYDNYPVNVKEQVSYVFEDGLNPNLEQILKLNPDLILLGSHHEELVRTLRELDIPVLKYDPQSIDAVYKTIEGIGKATNQIANAEKLVSDMKEKEQHILSLTSKIEDQDKVKVFTAVSSDLWTAGQETFFNELITKAGGINIVDQNGWVQINEEKVVLENPQVIFSTFGYYDPNSVINLLGRKGWENIDAIKDKKVIELDNDLVSRTGPRIIEGLETMTKALYPNLLK